MIRRVAIADVAEVNPSLPPWLRSRPDTRVVFVPMSAVSEEGTLTAAESRAAAEVAKGYTYFERGDILLAKITPCFENGKAALVADTEHQVGFGSTEFHVLRPGAAVDPRFLFYAVWNPVFRRHAVASMTGSAGQKRLPADALRRWRIPLPPPPEQRRIAAILDQADAIRRKRQQAIQLTNDLLRSAFLDMFGDPVTNPHRWQSVKLGSLLASKPQIGTITPATDVGEHRVVRVGELGEFEVKLQNCMAVDLASDQVQKYRLAKDDFLLTRAIGSEDHLGKASVFQGALEPIVFDSHVMRLRLDRRRLCPTFLWQCLLTSGGRRLMMRRARQTAVQFNINAEQVSNIDIPLPPLELQEQFSGFFQTARVFHQRLKQVGVENYQLFGSLVQRAFQGEL